MKKIELIGLDQSLYYEKLPSGLEVYLVPYKNKKNYRVHYATRYGSNQTEFVPVLETDMKKVPDGIAHFLEHKMFEQENNIDPFSFYAKSGTDCNASTSWGVTQYLFEGTSHIEENLDYLLTYVNRPHFTDENVEKEKGIIAEEIKMYQDDPDWKMEIFMKEATFHHDKTRVDIAGTIESIHKITKEDLYSCYDTFYQPSNMFLIAAGNIEPEALLEIIKKNPDLNNKKTNLDFEVKKVNEPKEVFQERVEVSLNIMNTKVGLTIKVPWNKLIDNHLYDMYLGAILTILFGSSSLYAEEIRKRGYATSFYQFREHMDEYLTINILAYSDVPDKFVEFVIDKLKNAPIEEADFERIKKVWVSSEVIMVDNVDITLDNLYYDIVEFGHIVPDKVDIIKSLSISTLAEIRKRVSFENYSVVVATPNKNEIIKPIK